MGHSGRHNCKQRNHTCGRECSQSEYANCNHVCVLEVGHSEPHMCNTQIHLCAHRCSAENCKSTCQIISTKIHTIHKCAETKCNKLCCMKCSRSCSSQDHFHGQLDIGRKYCEENQIPWIEEDQEHFCSDNHPCNHLCEAEGVCKLKVEMMREKVDETFVGKRGTFTYQAVTECTEEREYCCKRIPPKSKSHEGSHVHTLDDRVLHTCNVKCPSCGYFCELEYEHSESYHKASHGNMRNTYFISDTENIDIGEKKYVAGESGSAEMCNIFCSSRGRGHIHILPCDSADENVCTYAKSDGRRHQTKPYGPNEHLEKDELTHETYWKTIGFEDPCLKEEKLSFQLCPAQCNGEHEDDEVKYCMLELWHDPAVKGPADKGTISKDGHHYDCEHEQGRYHIVFCLDDSGSMQGRNWKDLCQAVYDFISKRLETSDKDLISFVIYNDTARVTGEKIPISEPNISQYLTFKSGGTNFASAFHECHEVLSRNDFEKYSPLLLFLSDGGSSDGDREVIALKSFYLSKGLTFYTIIFGNDSYGASKLKSLADLGGGTFLWSADGISLSKTFVEISSKLTPVIALAPR
eukprot:TRINITY_DN3211_c0_g1_i3.p1 TRINITY_DN3211_c0_g1~~TRINITY_DN3211_c0_g1_i3.p1  ORF type:complete len:578 (+),score=46.23 TRINITY_DN3211_c0_g1_i3:546-2279(+)